MGDFLSRISQIYYRFHDNDRTSKEYFHKFYTYLQHISFSEEEYPLLFDEPNST